MDELPLRFTVPGSKSQTQRELVLAALAAGQSALGGALDSDDTRHLRAALRTLGVRIDVPEDGGPWRVCGGALRASATALWCGDGGTVLRFLAPLALLLDGPLILDGSARLGERPHDGLLAALAQLGVERVAAATRGLPLTLRAPAPAAERARREVDVDASRSSQFASALLMVAPLLPGGLTVVLCGEAVSLPYLELTVACMRARGARVEVDGARWTVAPGGYRCGPASIEGDWSGAAFLLAAGQILGRAVTVTNVRADSPQGDRAIVALLAELGRPRTHELDLSACPDLLPPLAAAAVFAGQPSLITGVAHARIKESDRVATLAEGLAAAGVRVEQRPDALRVIPGGTLRVARLDPRGDHRMAMAFALLGLRAPGIEVRDPGCVSKSYPAFWDDLGRLRGGR